MHASITTRTSLKFLSAIKGVGVLDRGTVREGKYFTFCNLHAVNFVGVLGGGGNASCGKLPFFSSNLQTAAPESLMNKHTNASLLTRAQDFHFSDFTLCGHVTFSVCVSVVRPKTNDWTCLVHVRVFAT